MQIDGPALEGSQAPDGLLAAIRSLTKLANTYGKELIVSRIWAPAALLRGRLGPTLYSDPSDLLDAQDFERPQDIAAWPTKYEAVGARGLGEAEDRPDA